MIWLHSIAELRDIFRQLIQEGYGYDRENDVIDLPSDTELASLVNRVHIETVKQHNKGA